MGRSSARTKSSTSTLLARGGPKGGRTASARTEPGRISTQLHLRAERGGKPITLLLTAGERQAQSVFAPLLDQGAVRRVGRGRPRLRPQQIVGDKGYSSQKARQAVRRRGMRPVIPTTSNERWQPHFDRALYRERKRVERCINRLKQYRRVATRYEKRAVN